MSVPPAVSAVSDAVVEAALELTVSAHIAAIFEKTNRDLQQAYGVAPGAAVLARFWLSCATATRLRKEFESAVLQINDGVLAFENDEHDGDEI